jgi:hypothetical protein
MSTLLCVLQIVLALTFLPLGVLKGPAVAGATRPSPVLSLCGDAQPIRAFAASGSCGRRNGGGWW